MFSFLITIASNYGSPRFLIPRGKVIIMALLLHQEGKQAVQAGVRVWHRVSAAFHHTGLIRRASSVSFNSRSFSEGES